MLGNLKIASSIPRQELVLFSLRSLEDMECNTPILSLYCITLHYIYSTLHCITIDYIVKPNEEFLLKFQLQEEPGIAGPLSEAG